MVYQLAQGKMLYDCGKFCTREASPEERNAFYRLCDAVNLPSHRFSEQGGSKLTLVAAESGKVIGGVEAKLDLRRGYATCMALAVAPELQENRIGGILIKQMDEELSRRGIKTVFANVRNRKAFDVMEVNGYTADPIAKARAEKFKKGEDFVVNVDMVKELSPPKGSPPNRILHDAQEFYIRKARLSEEDEAEEMFRQHLFEGWVGLPGRMLLVAIDTKTRNVIGAIERNVNTKECCAHGAGLVVPPELQKRGIGAALVQAMDRELEETGIKIVTTIAQSEGSWKIFMANGYKYTPEAKEDLRKRGLPEDKFVKPVQMEKKL